MTEAMIIAVIILLIFAFERTSVTLATRYPVTRRLIRDYRIFHPNSISIIRMPMGILSVLFWIMGWHALSVVWFAFWMISDLSDGTIARNCDLVTERGKWLDPLSDKALYFPGLLYFAFAGPLPVRWAMTVVIFDCVGQTSRLFVKKKAANHFGKAKTALITVLLAVTALSQIGEIDFIPPAFLGFMTLSCAILAFLSFYCKTIPDIWYANSLTLANFLCGAAAIFFIVYRQAVLPAFILVFVGQFFDLFDGRLARKFGSTRYGAVFDDIADATSFGLAIGVMIQHQLGPGLPVTLLAAAYVFSVVFRLIRYLKRVNLLPPGVFEGMPTPGGALLAGSGVLLFSRFPGVAAVIVIISMILMASRLRYYHFGRELWPHLPNILKIAGFVIILVFVNYRLAITKKYPGTIELISFAIAIIYIFIGNVRIFDRLCKRE